MKEVNMRELATVIAILSIAILQGTATWRGMDGQTLWAAIAAIAGLGGYSLARHTKPPEPPRDPKA